MITMTMSCWSKVDYSISLPLEEKPPDEPPGGVVGSIFQRIHQTIFTPSPPPEKNPFSPLKEPPQTEESHRSPRKANDGTNESGAAQHIWSQLKSYHNFTTSRHQVANHIKCIPNAQCITELKVNVFKMRFLRWRPLNTRQASTPVDTW